MKSPSLSPREFLKSRRPEESSDSVHESREEIDRPHLEYHLDQLTSRRQETPFENFSRRLCEREICPNLIPQTGPVGGGDSKVDSETYPVSKQIVASWYVGDPDSAAGDRWAFAFSAKKKWLEKARSDIKGIHETARGYKKAFFVTNQFVRDKKRAEVEGELSRLYGMDVRIFDRTWILDKVFAKRHEDLVFDELGLELQSRDHFKLGLEDASKTDRLNAYEREISQCVANGKLDLLLVDHCLEAAILSRNLEKAREETEGRFLRARRNAEAFGTRHQQLLVEYQLAWTAFWYFEDADQFNEQFDRVLRFASGSDNSYDFELVNNLYSCLWMIFRTAKVSPDKLSMRERTREIQKNLGRLQSLVDRPSAALHARALALHVKLLNSDPQAAGEVFRDFRSLIESSEGHVGFPFARLTAVLCEIGKFFIGNREYDSLYESMSSLTSAREGETKGAELLVKRGEHLMAASEHAEAVRVLGRALRHLYRDETRNELIYALHMLSVAHQELGLLWAARGYCLMAGTLAMDELWKHSDVTRLQAAMLERMKWLELELGRLPVALAWHEADLAWKHLLPERDNDEGREEDDVMFSGCLGILFLNAELWDLKWLRQLPGTLDSLGLFEASLALRFALGGDVAPELSLTESQATPTDFFRMWRSYRRILWLR